MEIDEQITKEKEEAKRLRKIIETGYDGEMSCLDWLKSEVDN